MEIFSKRLEKFKHRNSPKNLLVESFQLLCSFSLQLIFFQNSRFIEIIRP